MIAELSSYFPNLQVTPVMVAMFGTGLGALLLVVGIAGAFGEKDPVIRRLEATGRPRNRAAEAGLLQSPVSEPRGIDRVLVPKDHQERSRVQRQLAQAGLTGPRALRNYYLLRISLGVVLPLAFLAMIWLVRAGLLPLPTSLVRTISGLSQMQQVQAVGIFVALGFFGPAALLERRSRKRSQAIQDAFPNTLDLLQVSVGAGLGVDAAMIRVANEIAPAAPEISAEILATQREIQAGRSRDKALLDMADRTQLEEVRAFVNVILQSAKFGTNISDVLTTYSQEMRLARELRAQEIANKLPVKMSAVLASLMLPALLLISIGPVVIRYIRVFGGGFTGVH